MVPVCVCVRVFVRDSLMSVSVTGTVQSTSAAFNSLQSKCGVVYVYFFEQTFAFHTSALFFVSSSVSICTHHSFSKTKEVRHFLPGFLFYSVLVEVKLNVLSGFVIESVLL